MYEENHSLEYYENDFWTKHKNGVYSVRRNPFCYLVVPCGNEGFSCYRGLLNGNVVRVDIVDGYLNKDCEVCCGVSLSSAIGIPKNGMFDRLDEAIFLAEKDYSNLMTNSKWGTVVNIPIQS